MHWTDPSGTLSRRGLLVGVAAGLGWAAGCGRVPTAAHPSSSVPFASALSAAAASASSASSVSTAVQITASGFLFSPIALVIPSGQSLTFVTQDATPYALALVPGAPATWPATTVRKGQTAQVTPGGAGVYHFYASAYATWDATLGVVVGLPTSPRYPVAMEGVVLVTGSGVTASAGAQVTAAATGVFTPEVVVISKGSTVTWTNATAGVCTVDSADDAFHLTVEKGQTAAVVMPSAGAYYYYSATYAQLQPGNGQAVALQGVAPGYPATMQGWIFVI